MSNPLLLRCLTNSPFFGVVAKEAINLIKTQSHYVRLHFSLLLMHRRRDPFGRFLSHNIQEDILNPKPKETHNKNEEEPFKNLVATTQEQIPSSYDESLHLNDLFAEPKCQDNPLDFVIYQEPLIVPLLGMA